MGDGNAPCPTAGALQAAAGTGEVRDSLGCSCRDNAAGPRRDAGPGKREGGDAPPGSGSALAPSNRSQLCCCRNNPCVSLPLSAGARRSAPPEPGYGPAEPAGCSALPCVGVPASEGGCCPVPGGWEPFVSPQQAVAALLPPGESLSS